MSYKLESRKSLLLKRLRHSVEPKRSVHVSYDLPSKNRSGIRENSMCTGFLAKSATTDSASND